MLAIFQFLLCSFELNILFTISPPLKKNYQKTHKAKNSSNIKRITGLQLNQSHSSYLA